MTFIAGGFFLSRTYTPPLFVYLALATAAAQVEARQAGVALPEATYRDTVRLAGLAVAAVPFMMFVIRLWKI